jgi:hypothetical protein
MKPASVFEQFIGIRFRVLLAHRLTFHFISHHVCITASYDDPSKVYRKYLLRYLLQFAVRVAFSPQIDCKLYSLVAMHSAASITNSVASSSRQPIIETLNNRKFHNLINNRKAEQARGWNKPQHRSTHYKNQNETERRREEKKLFKRFLCCFFSRFLFCMCSFGFNPLLLGSL